MLKVIISVSRKSLDWHYYKSAGHPCSLACLIMICSLLNVIHKEHNWLNGFFQPQSVLRCWIYRQCTAEFLAGKQQRLTVQYGLEWSAFVLCSLFSLLIGDVASAMKWGRLREKAPSPQAFITSSPLYSISGVFDFKARHKEVGGFLILASPRHNI